VNVSLRRIALTQGTTILGRGRTVFDWQQLRIFRYGMRGVGALCGVGYLTGVDKIYKCMHALAGNRNVLKTNVSCDYSDISYSLLLVIQMTAVVGT